LPLSGSGLFYQAEQLIIRLKILTQYCDRNCGDIANDYPVYVQSGNVSLTGMLPDEDKVC
jgi:hypothetical protein